jgi:DNA-binding response OmpR family regulator
VIGLLEVDFDAHTASRGGAETPLTSKEFDVLRYLWEHRGQAVSRDALLESVWGYDEQISTRTVDNFMLKLRQKLERDPANPRHIITLHGTGYKLVP